MSTLLSLTITFLDDRFHGQGDDGPEWPPSPHRVCQAMLCAAARNGYDVDEAFRWFESLAPPEILAPKTEEHTQEVQIFVPNNDADVPKKFARQNRLTSKTMRPTRMKGGSTTVRYLWTIQEADRPLAHKIIEHARRITAVGWGIDLVVANAEVVDKEEPAWQEGMQHWIPNGTGRNVLRCPVLGTLDDLREVYQSFLARIDGKLYQSPRRPAAFREVGYKAVGDEMPQRSCVAFKLLRPDDDSGRMASFDQRQAVHLAAWVRSRACLLADPGRGGSFIDGYDPEIYVAGHVPKDQKQGESPPRFSYLPIPTIGHQNADGRIRRFLVAGPYHEGPDTIGWVKQKLHLQNLTDKERQAKAILQQVRSDYVLNCYTDRSKTFHTVTPVFLTGHDDRNYRKTEKMLLKAIGQAGFSCEDLEDLFLQKAPFFPGAYHPRDYCLPKHIKQHHAAIHVRLTWKHAIAGPLTLGAGRFIGLGLFASVKEAPSNN